MTLGVVKQYIITILKKKAVKNGAWMYLLQVFNTIVPLLTLPYITRILGATQYGVVSIAINILGYYQVIVEYGFAMSATRKIALSDNGKENRNKIYTTVLLSRSFLLIICIILTGIYFLINRSDVEQSICLAILMVALLGNCLQLNWLFQGLQQMQFISIISMISRMLSVILIFVFVKSSRDIYLYCLLFSVSTFVNGLLGIVVAKKQYNIQLVKVTLNDIIEELKSGWYVFTTQLSSKVFGAIGITFLGIFATKTEVGVYSAIQKIPNILMLAWIPISQVMYPISSQKMQSSFKEGRNFVKKVQKVFVPLFLFGAIVISVSSRFVISFAFGEEYGAHFYWVIPLLFWLVISINNNFWGIQTLLGSGHDKEYSKCFQIGVLGTILFNLTLIFLFKGNGACVAPLLSELLLGVLLRAEINKLDKKMIGE